jgi:hypothetical protein
VTYQERHKKRDQVDYTHWKRPKLIVKILMEFFSHHQDTHISLLFDCLRTLCGRFLTNFQFLKDFLETEVSKKYSVDWKQAAFFEFIRLWRLPEPGGFGVQGEVGDPATRYHGHLLLSHIIAKFAIHKRIVLQVFHSLLKAHALEVRGVVRQALKILTPSMPGRMEDGNTMLTHWTKKIIVEDGHTGSQLVHILQLVVKHHKVYYPVRHHLMQHIVSSIQRLGFTATATLEQKRLAVDLCEVAIKW